MTTKNMNTPPGSTQENEIDLLRLVGELWDHRKFIISVTALFTLIAVAYSLLSTPIYQADTLVQVEQKQGNAILSGLSDMIPNSTPESAPEIQLPGTQFVLGQRTELEAINALQETFTVSERSKESGMLELTMTGDDPQLITRILNSIANNYLQQNIAR
ncbi:Wzz/FepE/Etk N-terminal domain-containing protein, partial [Escherichia marmotae]|nr:Wzz/FepE/Etk N-terminal domain-containing protein [Escherichia marmotae]